MFEGLVALIIDDGRDIRQMVNAITVNDYLPLVCTSQEFDDGTAFRLVMQAMGAT